MEKKRNQIARAGQSSSDFKNNKDVSSNKQQFPKQHKRREATVDNSSKSQSSKSSRAASNFYDKRPPRRNGGNDSSSTSAASSCSSAGLMDDLGELNSVFNHGSKKQNLNHLLNFHYHSAKDTEQVIRSGTFSRHGYSNHRSGHAKRYNFNKEQYLQANCQFIVKSDTSFDYRPFKLSPDNLVSWDQIVKILVSSVEESQCPICLYPPKAAKMTRCGHIYCSSCILHYLSLSDKSWRKCPICYESIHRPDLKSVSSKNNHHLYKVGDIINMELLKREKSSLFVVKAGDDDVAEFPTLSASNDETTTKLIMANRDEIMQIIEQEQNELEFQLIEDGVDCPESVFVQQAMELLKLKRDELKQPITTCTASKLNPSVAEFVPTTVTATLAKHSEESADAHCQFIEYSNLTVNDIDIVAESHLSQHFYFYQAPRAQNVFLHSINSRILQEMFGSLDRAPHQLRGRIVQIESCTMDEALRKRLKYLHHLPLASVFEVVEIEFEKDFVPSHVVEKFKDELLHRRKMRQRREREEKKHEKSINEINDRQMGKLIKTVAAMNVNIDSMQQFPECGMDEMPALPSTSSPALSSSPAASAGPSFANLLTTPKSAKKKSAESAWPSLSSPSTSSAAPSFFDTKKSSMQITSSMKAQSAAMMEKDNETPDEDDDDAEDDKLKTPAYHQLGDCLVSALQRQMQYGVSSKTGKKKKSKKTLLFSSGLNFN